MGCIIHYLYIMNEGIKMRQGNLWMISTIVLAVVLVALIAFGGGKNLFTQSKFKVIGTQQGSEVLSGFLQEVYGDKIQVTFNDISEENGLYKISAGIKDVKSGQDSNGFLYISQDGKLFIPQPINIDEALAQFRSINAPQPQPSADGSPLPSLENAESPAPGSSPLSPKASPESAPQ